MPNPHYVSGIICQSCGKQVFEDPHKQTRIYHRAYICQECGAVVPNHKFLHDHSCEGCRPATCNVCGGYTAWNVALNTERCMKCGAEFPRGE